MANPTRAPPSPEVNMFAGSAGPSFVNPEFKAAGRDILTPSFTPTFSPVVNLNVTTGFPSAPGNPETSAEAKKGGTETCPASLLQQASGESSSSEARTPKIPILRGVKRLLLGFLLPRHQQALLSEASTCFCKSEDATPSTETSLVSPDGASSSSLYSSQPEEDIEMSSAENLDARIQAVSQELTTPQVYVRSMLVSGKGLACWKPRPIRPYSGPRGVVPGDVGTYTADGGFKKILNLWDDEEALRTASRSTSDIVFQLPSREVAFDPEDIPQGHTIVEGASASKFSSEFDDSDTAAFEFLCHSQPGAVFVATSPAELEELVDHTELQECIIQHPQAIYTHANSIRRIANNESLYIITASIKSNSWALAAFKGVMPAPHDRMTLRNITRPEAQLPKYDWTHRATAEARFGSSAVAGANDQTLFLRGFKLDFSQGFRTRMKESHPASKGKSPDSKRFDPRGGSRPVGDGGEPGESNSSAQPDSGGSQTGTSGNSSSGGRTVQGSSAGCTRFTIDMSIQSFPLAVQDAGYTCHPSDAITKHLLDTTGADFALCHDDAWRFALADLGTSSSPEGFIPRSVFDAPAARRPYHENRAAEVFVAWDSVNTSTNPLPGNRQEKSRQLIVGALKGQDRAYVLRMGRLMEYLLRDTDRKQQSIEFRSPSLRPLIEGCAAYHKLAVEAESETAHKITLHVTPESCIPEVRICELIPAQEPDPKDIRGSPLAERAVNPRVPPRWPSDNSTPRCAERKGRELRDINPLQTPVNRREEDSSQPKGGANLHKTHESVVKPASSRCKGMWPEDFLADSSSLTSTTEIRKESSRRFSHIPVQPPKRRAKREPQSRRSSLYNLSWETSTSKDSVISRRSAKSALYRPGSSEFIASNCGAGSTEHMSVTALSAPSSPEAGVLIKGRRFRLRRRPEIEGENDSVGGIANASSQDDAHNKVVRRRAQIKDNFGVSSDSHRPVLSPPHRTRLSTQSTSSLILHDEGTVPVHFKFENTIRHGRHGAVYRATNLNTGQTVAIKKISMDHLRKEDIGYFVEQVNSVTHLCHPNIAKYVGICREARHLSIILEYVENGSLSQLLDSFGKLSEQVVAKYVIGVLEGLHYLHTNGVVHLGLKASNILATKSGNVKLADFGVSLDLRNLERESVDVLANWIAPEVIELKGASAKSDIWSLGCTVVELLTGKPPYAELSSSMAVMFRIVDDEMPPLPESTSQLAQDFLEQCFQKDPSARPSANILLEHSWLQNSQRYRELRPQDSIPFLRRVSADHRNRSELCVLFEPNYLQLATHYTSPKADTRLERTTHSFMKITFSKPETCSVCLLSVKKRAIICEDCALVAHANCAVNAPPACDLGAHVRAAQAPLLTSAPEPVLNPKVRTTQDRFTGAFKRSSRPSEPATDNQTPKRQHSAASNTPGASRSSTPSGSDASLSDSEDTSGGRTSEPPSTSDDAVLSALAELTIATPSPQAPPESPAASRHPTGGRSNESQSTRYDHPRGRKKGKSRSGDCGIQ